MVAATPKGTLANVVAASKATMRSSIIRNEFICRTLMVEKVRLRKKLTEIPL